MSFEAFITVIFSETWLKSLPWRCKIGLQVISDDDKAFLACLRWEFCPHGLCLFWNIPLDITPRVNFANRRLESANLREMATTGWSRTVQFWMFRDDEITSVCVLYKRVVVFVWTPWDMVLPCILPFASKRLFACKPQEDWPCLHSAERPCDAGRFHSPWKEDQCCSNLVLDQCSSDSSSTTSNNKTTYIHL